METMGLTSPLVQFYDLSVDLLCYDLLSSWRLTSPASALLLFPTVIRSGMPPSMSSISAPVKSQFFPVNRKFDFLFFTRLQENFPEPDKFFGRPYDRSAECLDITLYNFRPRHLSHIFHLT